MWVPFVMEIEMGDELKARGDFCLMQWKGNALQIISYMK
jgi:hypothetical protein